MNTNQNISKTNGQQRCKIGFDSIIMQYWRLAGLNYIQYSAVCARTLRRCLKTSAAKEAMKREESYIRVNKWQGGKIADQVHPSKTESTSA